LLELLKQLAKSKMVEILGSTYFHSLASLFPSKEEFLEQVKMHQQVMKELLHFKPLVFENTELLYNNAIAKSVQNLGYLGVITEGVERFLKSRSPNYVYQDKTSNLKLLLRNFKLTDDIGFRFSLKTWQEWPLTAQKYVNWMATTQGDCIIIFPDYETFGEHHWPETGIYDFLEHFPKEILKKEHLKMATPSEVLATHKVMGEIDVPELDGTVSWADTARDTSCWIGNTLQWAYYTVTRELEPLIKESRDEKLLSIWRYFLISDHLYYMYIEGGASGEVHSYFSHYDSPFDAAVTLNSAIFDFESRVRRYVVAANEPFLFYTDLGKQNYTGVRVWSLKGFSEAVKTVTIQSLEFHNQTGDFEEWAKISLRDQRLADLFKTIKLSDSSGNMLREKLQQVSRARVLELNQKFST